MAINPYALCPCGSGKKIKFCCGDLAGEMEKVFRMVEGDQSAAAVRHLEQLLKKNPGRVSLLDLKSAIEMRLGWHDQAKGTIEEYIAADPENPNAWGRRASLLSIAGNLPEATEAAQKAIEFAEDPPYTTVVLSAIRMLGQATAENGDVIAAIALFLLYSDVSPTGDLEGERELIRLTRELPIPELIKGPFQLRRDGLDSEHSNEFQHAEEMARRGAWLRSAELLEALQARAPGSAALLYDTALLRGYLGDHDAMARGLREYAQREVPHDDAVEALALAQALAFDAATERINVKELFFEIEDVDDLAERLRQNDRAPRMSHPSSFWSRSEDGPTPQYRFFVLDRPDPPEWEGLSLDGVPRVLACVELYGRETDRPPRAVVRLTIDGEYESKLNEVRGVLGVGEAAPVITSDYPGLSALANYSIYHTYAPDGLSVKKRKELMEQSRLQAVFDVWPATRQAALGGSAPGDLVGDPSRQLELEAAVLRLFETYVDAGMVGRLGPLYERLGVQPLPTGLDPREIPADRLTFVRVRRVDPAKLDDMPLAKIALQAAILDASRTTTHLAPEILRRPQLHATVNVYTVCQTAAMEAPDFEWAASFLNDARRLIAPELVPSGIWDILAFEAAMDFLAEEHISDLFNRAAKSADANEDVARVFVRVLAERGLLTRDGRLRGPVADPGSAPSAPAAPAGASETPKIWTPDSEAAEQGQGKIWTPS